jgi:hypothetical protein
MKTLFKGKDGGPESKVYGYWLFESKKFGSICLLRFEEGSREVYHTHAFDAVSWVLKGQLREEVLDGETLPLTPSIKPILTKRERFHRVFGIAKNTWVLSFRGPWLPKWKEYLPVENKSITLTNGRKIVENSRD